MSPPVNIHVSFARRHDFFIERCVSGFAPAVGWSAVVRKPLASVCEIRCIFIDEVHAPVAQGDQLGTLTVTLPEGREISLPLKALNPVKEAGFFVGLWDSIQLIFLKLFGGDPLAYKP